MNQGLRQIFGSWGALGLHRAKGRLLKPFSLVILDLKKGGIAVRFQRPVLMQGSPQRNLG